MMIKSLPKSLTLEEAVAVLMNIESIPPTKTVDEFLDEIYEDSALEHGFSQDKGEPEYIQETLLNRRELCGSNAKLAIAIKRALVMEIRNLDDESVLQENNENGTEFKITTQSLIAWADRFLGRSITPMTETDERAPARTYQSKYFDILEAAASEHWNGVETESQVPKNEVIKLWVRQNYPDSNISGQVLDTICTIIRPDKFK